MLATTLALLCGLLQAWQGLAVGCGQCEFEDHVEYAGGDLLPETYGRPAWWTGTWGGMTGVAPKLASREECCTFCVEWNRQRLQPPCVVATFTLAPEDTRQLCFPKGPAHQPRSPGTIPRVACLPGVCARACVRACRCVQACARACGCVNGCVVAWLRRSTLHCGVGEWAGTFGSGRHVALRRWWGRSSSATKRRCSRSAITSSSPGLVPVRWAGV